MLVMSGNVFAVPSSLPVPGFSPDLINESSNPNPKPISNTNPSAKKKRNLPGTPDPDAEVIALSPKTLMATNRFICEICNKGFQREQNLQLHRRGHNLPWKLRQKTNKDQVKKKVYICPEKSCVHHDPCRALGDLTGIKKHFSRKHGEKKWKCEKCSKKYAVQSDWKAHSKTCGTREYKCDCGTLFSRKDSFITHRAFCDALAEESSRITSIPTSNLNFRNDLPAHVFTGGSTGIPQIGGAEFGNQLKPPPPRLSLWLDQANSQQLNSVDVSGNSSIYMNSANIFTSSAGGNLSLSPLPPLQQSLKDVDGGIMNKSTSMAETLSSLFSDDNHRNIGSNSSGPMSATALLQKAAQMGSTKSNPIFFSNSLGVMSSSNSSSSSPVPVPVPAFSLSHNRNQQLLQTTTSSLDNNSFEFDQSMLQTSQNESPSTTTVTMMNFQGQGLNGGSVEHHNSLTRDFLGMGAGEGGRPLLPHELAKFASMSSAMGLDLGHFSSHH